jgi:hypothetical protein
MAQKVLVTLEDDLSGGPAEETIKFMLDDVQYEIDLNASHAADLRVALEPFVESARRVRGSNAVKRRTSATSETDRARRDAVRDWALDQGLEVAKRGRIAASVYEAYDREH